MGMTASSIKLLKLDIPLSVDNQLTFGSVASQYNYFNSKTAYTFNNISYQRKERFFKANIECEIAERCNYLIIQNSDFSNKCFYAFITKCEYVAPNTTLIYYQIDSIQTYFFDMRFNQTFVVREHIANDEMYISKTPEPFSVSATVLDSYFNILGSTYSDFIYLVFCSSGKANLFSYCLSDFGGSSNACNVIYCNSISAIELLINKLEENGIADSIVGIATSPRQLDGIDIFSIAYNENMSCYEVTGVDKQRLKRIDSSFLKPQFWQYEPKNNKLYNYPYCKLMISDINTKSIEYAPELFSGIELVSGLICGLQPQPYAWLNGYNGEPLGSNHLHNTDYVVLLSQFPQTSYKVNSYDNYLGQNSTFRNQLNKFIPNDLQGTSNALMESLSGAKINISSSSSPTQALGSTISYTTQCCSNIDKFSNMKKNDQVNQVGSNTAFGTNAYPKLASYHIDTYNARLIDHYFDMYGYSVNDYKYINYNTRPNHNFLQTANANCFGEIPTEHTNDINAIFNGGVTFWHIPSTMGNYDVLNK